MELGTRTGRTHTWHNRSLGVGLEQTQEFAGGLEQTQEFAGEVPEWETELVALLLVGN